MLNCGVIGESDEELDARLWGSWNDPQALHEYWPETGRGFDLFSVFLSLVQHCVTSVVRRGAFGMSLFGWCPCRVERHFA